MTHVDIRYADFIFQNVLCLSLQYVYYITWNQNWNTIFDTHNNIKWSSEEGGGVGDGSVFETNIEGVWISLLWHICDSYITKYYNFACCIFQVLVCKKYTRVCSACRMCLV